MLGVITPVKCKKTIHKQLHFSKETFQTDLSRLLSCSCGLSDQMERKHLLLLAKCPMSQSVSMKLLLWAALHDIGPWLLHARKMQLLWWGVRHFHTPIRQCYHYCSQHLLACFLERHCLNCFVEFSTQFVWIQYPICKGSDECWIFDEFVHFATCT